MKRAFAEDLYYAYTLGLTMVNFVTMLNNTTLYWAIAFILCLTIMPNGLFDYYQEE